ncbi:riboflavin synthase [Streptomyces sp. HSW2009]|uniref:riboflavin synthase n=1 Tax=Streptomyces sp. HSW2009 TaxID=3142890 RepID=UPI0032EAAAF2
MFTGIVEELGEIAAIEELGDAPAETPEALEAATGTAAGTTAAAPARAARLSIHGPKVTADAQHGDSIAVNGVCLTVVAVQDGTFTADVMAETLHRSSLGALRPGSRVNLERPMALGGRLGGHLVQGHVDGTGVITHREPAEHWEVVTVSLPPELTRYVVEKGSITVDGISLTVVDAATDHFTVSLIPTTLALTTLGHKQVGDPVNLEVDVLAKYVERLLAHGTVPGAPSSPAQGAADIRAEVAR